MCFIKHFTLQITVWKRVFNKSLAGYKSDFTYSSMLRNNKFISFRGCFVVCFVQRDDQDTHTTNVWCVANVHWYGNKPFVWCESCWLYHTKCQKVGQYCMPLQYIKIGPLILMHYVNLQNVFFLFLLRCSCAAKLMGSIK